MDSIIESRLIFFNNLLKKTPLIVDGKTLNFACSCCGYPALSIKGTFDICAICDWEDDPECDSDYDLSCTPNHALTLREARFNFEKNGITFKPKSKDLQKLKILIRNEYDLLANHPSEFEAIQKRLSLYYQQYKVLLLDEED